MSFKNVYVPAVSAAFFSDRGTALNLSSLWVGQGRVGLVQCVVAYDEPEVSWQRRGKNTYRSVFHAMSFSLIVIPLGEDTENESVEGRGCHAEGGGGAAKFLRSHDSHAMLRAHIPLKKEPAIRPHGCRIGDLVPFCD